MADRLPRSSRAQQQERIDALRELVPEAFPEGTLDLERLARALGVSEEDVGAERYGLSWAGKSDAVRQLGLSSRGALRPSPGSSLDWDRTQNLFIEGDNLEVLRLLQRAHAGSAALIYIDPPYNTGEEFVYTDDFRDSVATYLEITGQRAGRSDSEPVETAGRLHSRWLSMLYPRLALARTLLRHDGVLCVSIDEHEHHNLVLLLCEIFGEENHLGDFIWKKKSGGGSDARGLILDHEYIVCFGRSSASGLRDDPLAEVSTRYPHSDEKGRYALERLDKQNLGYEPSLDFPITSPDGAVHRVHHKNPEQPQARWRWSKATVEKRYEELVFRGGSVYTRNYQSKGARPRSLLVDRRFGRTRTGRADLLALFESEPLEHPKPLRLLQHLIRVSSGPEDLIIDFFAGSASTAHAVYAVNQEDESRRRFLCVQLPAPCPPDSKASVLGFGTIADLAAERIRRAAAALPPPRPDEDRGFRHFRLDSSSWRSWEEVGGPGAGDDLPEILADFAEPTRSGRSPEDLLYEVLLRAGLPLSSPVAALSIGTAGAWRVGDGKLTCCLEAPISVEQVAEAVASGSEQLVLLDRAFGTDEVLRARAERLAEDAGVRLIVA